MGGNAFARASAQGEPTLSTPRLSKEDYWKLRDRLKESFHAFFGADARLDTLFEAPEKTDYGDIDFIVAHDEHVDWVELAKSIGATGLICHHSGMCSLAVPKDGSRSSRPPVTYKLVNDTNSNKSKPSKTVNKKVYAQVDVGIIPRVLYQWRVFYCSYGDMAGLLGQIVRNLGFTIRDTGLWLRMKELDDSKLVPYLNIADRDGSLFLSDESAKVMGFLGLSVERHDEGFASLDELYAWLGTCRLLSIKSLQIKRDNADDRNREAKRTVFSRFFNEWLPTHFNITDTAEQRSLDNTRETLVKEATNYFGKQAEYTTMHNALIRNIDSAAAAHLLRPIVKLHSGREDKSINEIIRAFRRFAGVDEKSEMHVLEISHTDAESELYRLLAEDKQSFKDWGKVSDFVKDRWAELRTLERRRVEAAKGERAADASVTT